MLTPVPPPTIMLTPIPLPPHNKAHPLPPLGRHHRRRRSVCIRRPDPTRTRGLQDLRARDSRSSVCRSPAAHRRLAYRRSGGYQHRAPRRSEDAMPQNQNRRHQRSARRKHSSHSQQGEHVAPVSGRLPRGLTPDPRPRPHSTSFRTPSHPGEFYNCCRDY